MEFGLSCEKELQVLDESVVEAGELDVRGDTLENGGVGEFFGDTFSIASIVETGFRCRKIVLVVGVLDVSEEVATLAANTTSYNDFDAAPGNAYEYCVLGLFTPNPGNSGGVCNRLAQGQRDDRRSGSHA